MTAPKVHSQKSHDGSELIIHSVINFGDCQEVLREHRQFLKGRNFITDAFIPYWNPSQWDSQQKMEPIRSMDGHIGRLVSQVRMLNKEFNLW
jgi:hypothetical protein